MLQQICPRVHLLPHNNKIQPLKTTRSEISSQSLDIMKLLRTQSPLPHTVTLHSMANHNQEILNELQSVLSCGTRGLPSLHDHTIPPVHHPSSWGWPPNQHTLLVQYNLHTLSLLPIILMF